MTDYVNDYFSQHPNKHGAFPRPRLTLADGTSLSIQASAYHYCTPKDNTGPYSSIEVGFVEGPSGRPTRPRSFGSYGGGVWGWVPVSAVNAYIKRHGGLQGENT